MEWPKLITYLQDLKKHGAPSVHVKHEGWVEGNSSNLPSPATLTTWKQVFQDLAGMLATKNTDIVWVIIEGFVLYWHPDVVSELDIRLFLRGEYGSMKSRREIRGEYHAPDGYIWSDPPDYWDNVVWPAYLKAHQHLLVNRDINGTTAQPDSDPEFMAPINEGDTKERQSAAGLIVLPAENTTVDELVEISCKELRAFLTVLMERETGWWPGEGKHRVNL